jgi:hypothetical protein
VFRWIGHALRVTSAIITKSEKAARVFALADSRDDDERAKRAAAKMVEGLASLAKPLHRSVSACMELLSADDALTHDPEDLEEQLVRLKSLVAALEEVSAD